MKLLFLFFAIAIPGSVFAAAQSPKRKPSGTAVSRPPLRLELSARDDSEPQWNCGACTQDVSHASNGDSLVNRMVRYDTLFQSMIDSATRRDAYRLKFKVYF